MASERSADVACPSDRIGFECLHYSVFENSGHVSLVVNKRVDGEELPFGIRTLEIPDAAAPYKEFEPINQIHTFKRSETQKTIKVPIMDNEGW